MNTYKQNTLGFYFAEFAKAERGSSQQVVVAEILPYILDAKFLREDLPSTSVCGKAIIRIVKATADYLLAISNANTNDGEEGEQETRLAFALTETKRMILSAACDECGCIYYG